MNKVLELKRHIRNILDALSAGEYRKGTIRCEYKVPDTEIIHKHLITYFHRGQDICYDYNYMSYGLDESSTVHLDIDTTVDDAREEDSFIIITEKKQLAYKFVPSTMDHIKVLIRFDGGVTERIPLKDILTEEQFFMYSTLYDLPEFDDVKELAVMGQQLRGEMMRKRIKIQGMFAQEIVDMESEAFLYEAKYG